MPEGFPASQWQNQHRSKDLAMALELEASVWFWLPFINQGTGLKYEMGIIALIFCLVQVLFKYPTDYLFSLTQLIH